jgi:hypothetical protein
MPFARAAAVSLLATLERSAALSMSDRFISQFSAAGSARRLSDEAGGAGGSAAARFAQPLASRDLAGVAELLRSGAARNVVVMLGAGASVSAGIPDFRTPGTGLYDNLEAYDLPYPEAIFDLEFFREKPEPFYLLCKARVVADVSRPPLSSPSEHRGGREETAAEWEHRERRERTKAATPLVTHPAFFHGAVDAAVRHSTEKDPSFRVLRFASTKQQRCFSPPTPPEHSPRGSTNDKRRTTKWNQPDA